MAVTSHAVGSYPTFSPLPLRAVCFLWRYLERYRYRPLTGAIVLWSPDFPQGGDPPAIIYPTGKSSNDIVELALVGEFGKTATLAILLVVLHVLLLARGELLLGALNFLIVQDT